MGGSQIPSRVPRNNLSVAPLLSYENIDESRSEEAK
jgi:hypothetical protein